jgi:hypothetical protein
MPFAEAVAQLAPGFAVEGSAEAQKAQLLCLRGLLGCGILVHCLTLRHRVEYGINFKCASLASGPLLPQAAPICVVARRRFLRGLLQRHQQMRGQRCVCLNHGWLIGCF